MSEIQFNANLKKAENDESLTEQQLEALAQKRAYLQSRLKTSLLLHNYKIILRLTVYTKSMS